MTALGFALICGAIVAFVASTATFVGSVLIGIGVGGLALTAVAGRLWSAAYWNRRRREH
jgi:hypothetical protein